jgi:cell division protein FtsQ
MSKGGRIPSRPEAAGTQKKKKKRKKKRYLLKFFLFLCAAAALGAFLASDFFAVDNISVLHNNNYTKQEIVEMSGIKAGTNLFAAWFEKGKVRERMEGDSYIDTVDVSIKLPGTVVLNVDERREIAAVPLDDKYILIDNEGYVLRSVAEEPQLTLLVGLTITGMKEGRPLQTEEASLFEETLSMLRTIESSDLYFKKIDISEVVIKAYIYDRLVCKGTPENITHSMETGNLQIILYDLYKKGINRGTINVGEGEVCAFSPNLD